MNAGVDAIELEVFKHLFASVAEEMGVRLMRSAYSPNIKERLDYSCALFDGSGAMVAQAAHIPVHLGSAGASVRAIVEAFGAEAMRPGDRFIVNDPFAGGTHLPDITVVAPFFGAGDAAPRFFVANRAHHADVGGKSAGSMPMSTSIDEEGVRIGPSRLDQASIRMICEASRTPIERRGDLMAQQAALEVGLSRLAGLCASHGVEKISRQAAALQDYTERVIRSILRDVPDGRCRFEDVLEGDGHGAGDIALVCELSIEGEAAVFDFRDSDDQVTGPVNAVRAITVSAVMYALRCLAPTELPSNEGVIRPARVLTRPGSVVDAVPPAAVAAGNVETSQRLVDVIFGALSRALPDRIPAASCGTMNNLTLGGADLRQAGHPAFAYYETLGGGAGAGPNGDGASAVQVHMTNTRNTPIEALEHAYPFRVETYAVRRGSGGTGAWRGGDGIVRRYVFDAPVELTLLTERRTRGPWGLRGGGAGAPGENRRIGVDGSVEILPAKCHVHLAAGEALEILTPGGGGYGNATG